MSETPRTDAVVNKLQYGEASFIDSYVTMLDFARELERSLVNTRTPASRKMAGRRPTSSTSKKKAPRKPES
ncbi:MAG: hypothetical protein ABGZ49_05330 [Akkermansiaceae bacterium]